MRNDEPAPADFAADLKAQIRRRLARNRVALAYRSRPAKAANSLDAAARSEITKIFDELVSNVLKHSGADKVSLSIIAAADRLTIRFMDNGSGFDPQRQQTAGSGLANIRFRIEQLDGQLALASRPRRGTVYRLQIPLRQPETGVAP